MTERTPIWERANGRWEQIFLSLTKLSSADLNGKHHGCPTCGGKDRWRFDDKEGNGTSICNQCGSRSGYKLLKDLLHLEHRELAEAIEGVIGTDTQPTPRSADDAQADRVQQMLREIGAQAVPVTPGDPVHRYLTARVPGLKFVPKCIRLVEQGEYFDKATNRSTVHPMMVATVVDRFGDAIAMHRTFLTADGHKAPVPEAKRSLGKLPDGIAVRLAKATDVVGIAEGIETALAAMAMHRIPVWAALNAGRLQTWWPPESVTQVVVFGDADQNYVGQAAAFTLGSRLEAKKIATQVMIPDQIGQDWNDIFQQKKASSMSQTVD